MNVTIDESLWKRIEHFARLYKKSPEEYFLSVLDNQIPRIPDPARADAEMARIRAEAGPEDDYDLDEFLRTLEGNRGDGVVRLNEMNGVSR